MDVETNKCRPVDDRVCATVVYGVVTILCLVCYSNSLDGDFVHDDIVAIVRNPDVQGSTAITGLLWNDFWGKPMCDPASHKSYRPLTTLTFRLNRWFSGISVRGYHMVNILLHTLVSIQFTFLCRRHLAWDWENVLTAAILFATHPIHTEAVSSVVGRAEVLSAIFFLFGLVAFLSKAGPILRLLMTCVCGHLALLAKEQGIMVLLVCIASYFLPDTRRFEKKRRKKKVFADRELLTLVSALALGIGCRMWILQGSIPQFSEQDNPASHNPVLQTRLLTYFHLPAANLWLLLCPLTLSYDWQLGSVPLVTSLYDSRNFYSLATYCALAGLIWRLWTLHKPKEKLVVYLGLSILVLPFLPASNLLLPVGFVVAERVLYIPSLGFCILVVEGLKRSKSPSILWAARTITVVMILLFCLRTVRRNQDWVSRETLFRSGLKSAPQNAKVHYNFANLQKDKGNKELAIVHYKEAISLWPNYASAHNNLGTLLSEQELAERHFRAALWIAPEHARAHYNLAALYRAKGHLDLAVWLLNRAVTFDPELEDAFTLLAAIYTESGAKTSKSAGSSSRNSSPPSGTSRHATTANQTARRAQSTLLYHVTVDRETMD